MLRNYLRTAWQHTFGNFSFNAINILGLAAGLASFIIILLYLNYELSYDKWNPELKKIYKVSIQKNTDILERTPAPLGALLAQKFPNAEAATSIQSDADFELLLDANNKKIYQKDIVTVDSSFLKVFPYKLISGDAATALNQPNAAILTEELSRKLFGDTDPMGKTIKVYNAIECVITGVMEDLKGPSQLTVKMLMRDPYGKQNNFWGNYSFVTYLKLKHTDQEAKTEDAVNRIYYDEHLKRDTKSFEAYKKAGQGTFLFVDAVPNIYNFPKHGSSQFKTVSILLTLAVLLLLAGAINFSNLSIAKAISRAKEVGVRKVLGSSRRQLVFQFMTETAFQCMISLCIAILIVYMALPYVNNTFNINLSFWQQDNTVALIAQIALCLLIVILLSGLYPSLFLSRFNTTKVLKGNYSSGNKGMLFRNSLIVVQFMVSVFFIISILVIRSQMHYMQRKDKGFSADQVMRIQASQKNREDGFPGVQNALLSINGVSYVAKTTKIPGDNLFIDTSTYGFKYAGKEYRMSSVKVSTDYFKALKIALIKGRYFTNGYADQNTRSAIINETAARKMNIADPVGKTITYPDCDSIPVQIVGVVKDFHAKGFESNVLPEVYTIGNKACMYQSGGAIVVKLDSKHVQQSVAAIEQAWKKIEPDFPIRYSFLDDNFQKLFISYSRLQQIITFFAVIAIMISVMGLFALTAFFTRQRTKEIGVRKVMGATVAQLAALLSKEFVYLVLLSVVIITPVAWWFMQKWLQTFAYRINVNWWLFFAAGFVATLIALVTISFQSIKAALANPVKSLRNE
ncbi:MAG: FtsX-like permease family protein [Mucilaginibacter sp.]|nr:FtsX-like permease family protein [Mucilaginibacter sp.]